MINFNQFAENNVFHHGFLPINNKCYTLYLLSTVTKQCVSRGDPHLTTFDGAQVEEFRTNNGEFVFFDFKSFHFENPVPDMR